MKYPQLSRLLLGMGLLLAVFGIWMGTRYESSEIPQKTSILSDVGIDPTVTSIPATNTPQVSKDEETDTSGVSRDLATNTATKAPSRTPTPQVSESPKPTPTSVPPTPTETVPSATATATPLPARAERLVIASIGVDAPVQVVGLDEDRRMQAPDGPINVGWYDIENWAHPGEIGNLVFAGHVDYAGHGPAVFWDLDRLLPGDVIDVYTDDGGIVSYRVTELRHYSSTENAEEAVAATSSPTITLITCDGSFDSNTRQYNERLVVVGELIKST